MEVMIEQISHRGKEKNKIEIEEKVYKKIELEKSIDSLKRKILFYNNNKQFWIRENRKVEMEVDRIKSASVRIKRTNEDITKLEHEVNYEKRSVKEIYANTYDLIKKIDFYNSKIEFLDEEIKQIKKNIFDIEKQNEYLRTSVKIIKKHKDAMYNKLNTQILNNNQIMNNIGVIFKTYITNKNKK